MDKRLVSELIKTRNAVKKKYKSLKADMAQSQSALAEQFKPISQPLQELISTIKTEGKQMKEKNLELKQSPKKRPASPSTPTSSQKQSSFNGKPIPFQQRPALFGTPNKPAFASTPIHSQTPFLQSNIIGEISPEHEQPELVEEFDVSDQTVQEAMQTVQEMMRPEIMDKYLEQYQGLARQYIEDMIRDTQEAFDLKYGVRLDIETNKFAIGNKELHFQGSDMFIMDGGNKVQYKGTPGFYELMFKKTPIGYTQTDEGNYVDIIKRSAANRRNYDPTAPINGNAGKKYRNIVRPLMTNTSTPKSARRGAGLLNVNDKNVEFVPWKDPNTLVDRLQILIASQFAGHTGHNNEIVRIIEALKRAKIIK